MNILLLSLLKDVFCGRSVSYSLGTKLVDAHIAPRPNLLPSNLNSSCPVPTQYGMGRGNKIFGTHGGSRRTRNCKPDVLGASRQAHCKTPPKKKAALALVLAVIGLVKVCVASPIHALHVFEVPIRVAWSPYQVLSFVSIKRDEANIRERIL
jgi:hypothetical protein